MSIKDIMISLVILFILRYKDKFGLYYLFKRLINNQRVYVLQLYNVGFIKNVFMLGYKINFKLDMFDYVIMLVF